jgi:hypothetical protein
MKFGLNWLMIHHILKALQIKQGHVFDSFKDPSVVGGWIGKMIGKRVCIIYHDIC